MKYLDEGGLKNVIDKVKVMLSDKADKAHDHDDMYYSKFDIDTSLGIFHSEILDRPTQAQVKAQIDQKFVLCTNLDDAKSKQSSGSYPLGTIFLIKKEG